MSHAALELQAALVGLFRADDPLAALLGSGGIEDGPHRASAFPYVAVGEWTSHPLDADGGGQEHILDFVAWSRAGGRAQALDILARLGALGEAADLTLTGYRLVSLALRDERVTRGRDGRSWRASVTFRAITEPA